MAMRKGAELIAEFLIREKIPYVFGICGHGNVGLLDALYDVKDEISKSQRDYFLREQGRAIHRELGEDDEKAQEVLSYRKKIKRAKMSKEAEKEALKQASNL